MCSLHRRRLGCGSCQILQDLRLHKTENKKNKQGKKQSNYYHQPKIPDQMILRYSMLRTDASLLLVIVFSEKPPRNHLEKRLYQRLQATKVEKLNKQEIRQIFNYRQQEV